MVKASYDQPTYRPLSCQQWKQFRTHEAFFWNMHNRKLRVERRGGGPAPWPGEDPVGPVTVRPKEAELWPKGKLQEEKGQSGTLRWVSQLHQDHSGQVQDSPSVGILQNCGAVLNWIQEILTLKKISVRLLFLSRKIVLNWYCIIYRILIRKFSCRSLRASVYGFIEVESGHFLRFMLSFIWFDSQAKIIFYIWVKNFKVNIWNIKSIVRIWSTGKVKDVEPISKGLGGRAYIV